MFALLNGIQEEPTVRELLNAVNKKETPAVMGGLSHIHRAHIISAIKKLTDRPVTVICSDELEQNRLIQDIEAFTGEEVLCLTGREFVFFDADTVSRNWEYRRLGTFGKLLSGQKNVMVATVDALMQRTLPPEVLREAVIDLKIGDMHDFDELSAELIKLGYRREEKVEEIGQFALRGGILDIFSPGEKMPVRCEFFGDELDAMGLFDPETQSRTENIFNTGILPVRETVTGLAKDGVENLITQLEALHKKKKSKETLAQDIERLKNGVDFSAVDRYLAAIYPKEAYGTDFILKDSIIIMTEPSKVKERAKNYLWQHEQNIKAMLEEGKCFGEYSTLVCQFDSLCGVLEKFQVVMLDTFFSAEYPLPTKKLLSMTAKQMPSYGGSFEAAFEDISQYAANGYGVLVLCGDELKASKLEGMLKRAKIPCVLDYKVRELPEAQSVRIGIGSPSAGMEYPELKLAVICEGQFSAKKTGKKQKKRDSARQRIYDYSELAPGDVVVHEHHGIGRFSEIVTMHVDGVDKEYIKILYSGSDSLYVPATSLDMVSKYIGGGEDKPVKLNKLGGSEWQRTKAKARKAVKELAQDLVKLYAQREKQKGHAFSPDTVWQKEFEDSFEYTETEDQLRAANEIKRDMENAMPMERLLCGDVGYGKTEVALRAVMKCVMDGKQVAMLVPTTVLAQQHYLTAKRRFKKYPIEIAVMNRFLTSAQAKNTAAKISAGAVDFVIGTHRLLQKDIVFKDLGLIIVDEEQRFGVGHKEQLKTQFSQVDVLTLSATPIPRTLNMALSGIRDMSVLEDPPHDRYPVQTYVMEYDAGVIADAIRREIARGGQVYYLHNRVESIERAASFVASLDGSISVGIAHGKMNEKELTEVMHRMTNGDLQVLVCTTIIESGIDIPNVNTLIVEDADKLGLAQLHQIRGRVGRSSRRAFAYLTYRKGKILTEISTKRLEAIREFAEFGSGFRIAMKDLEIRGAGDILGAEQSGHMLSVGYDMYLKLLEEAVADEKGETAVKPKECTVDISIPANIPASYITSQRQRIELYRRIAHVKNADEADELMDEICDRFGDIPRDVMNLFEIALLRADAGNAGIKEISQKSGRLIFKLHELNLQTISQVCGDKKYRGRLLFSAGEESYITLKLLNNEKSLDAAKGVVEDIGNAMLNRGLS